MLLSRLGSPLAGLGVFAVFKAQIQRVFKRPVAEEEVAAMWEQIRFLDGHKRLAQTASYLRERTRFEERWISALRTSDAVPVHLLWGNRDPTSVVRIGKKLAAEIPGATLTRLVNVGHYPQLEAPEETAQTIQGWLSLCEQASAQVTRIDQRVG
jgi:pimeloyl-ACP methyl ester carboxylesterase